LKKKTVKLNLFCCKALDTQWNRKSTKQDTLWQAFCECYFCSQRFVLMKMIKNISKYFARKKIQLNNLDLS